MDARTTAICRARDGMILRLDDDRLPGNTPPLHFMCRSTLVAITDWVWADLEAGDERALKRWFGWLKSDQAPHDLASALGGWADVPPPLKGFGEVGAGPMGRTPALPKPVTPKPATDTPDLREWVQERKALGIDDFEDVRDVGRRVLVDVQKQILRKDARIEKDYRVAVKREASAQRVVDKARAKGGATDAQAIRLAKTVLESARLRDRLATVRSESVSEVLAEIRPQGGVGQRWAPGTKANARVAVARASVHLPKDWLQLSADFGEIRGKETARGYYGHPMKAGLAELSVRRGSGAARQYKTALHELGHRMEYLVPQLQSLARDYLEHRTRGERRESLATLLSDRRYRGEYARKDKFTHPYFGKEYPDATEIVSMGLEAVFLSEYNVWEEDLSLLEFLIGALAAL
jgi:hypothetical protein